MIKLVNVSKIYNNNGVLTTGLHNVSIELTKNEIVAITGESGSGKSTLLNVLTKMDLFDEGEYYYKGNETSYFDINDMDNFRKNKVGFIFQNYNIIDSYSVLENVMLPFRIKGIDKKIAKERALELIKKVGLENRIKNRGTQLSGGEKQRCVIARALASDCDILACDEPTGNLDSQTSAEIIALIKEIAKDKLVLIVTHSYEQVKDIVTRKIKVHNGEIVEDIIYEEKPLDEEEVIDLDYVRIKNKTIREISLNNLVKTPRKTVLTMLVLLFVCFFALTLYQAIYFISNDAASFNSFPYQSDNKLIVYKPTGDRLVDMEDIKSVSSDYIINEFATSGVLQVDWRLNDYQYGYSRYFNYERNPENLKLDGGRMPEAANECIVLLPDNLAADSILDTTLTISSSFMDRSIAPFKVVGFQYRDDIDTYTLTKNDQLEIICHAACLLRPLEEYTYGNFTYNITEVYGGIHNETAVSGSDFDVVFNPTIEKSYFVLSDRYQTNETQIVENFTFSEKFSYYIYEFPTYFNEIEITFDSITRNTLYLGIDMLQKAEELPYEVTVYTNKPSQAMREFERMGYACLQTSKYTTYRAEEIFYANLTGNLLMILSSVVIVIIYFISYIILSKIYTTKKKDYTIFRTLGISKRDMKNIVINEIMFQTIFISVLTYLVMYVIRLFTTKGFMILYRDISLFGGILYFVIIFFFGYLIARRFNHRLFKFSVNETLKGGEANND